MTKPSPSDPSTPTAPTAPAHWVREEGRYLLEIFALCGFAVAQPLLDVFGRSPETFVFRGAGRGDIVLFAAAVALLPPLALGVAAALTRLGGRDVRSWVQTGLLSVLAGLVALHAAKLVTGLRGWALAVVASAVAAAFAATYRRVHAMRMWAAYAGPSPLVFLLVFLLISPVSNLVFADDVEAVELEGSTVPRRIVMLVLDEFPTTSLVGQDGLVDADLFPNLRAFADDATWYRNFTTVNSSSMFAVPSLLSGRYPRDELPTAANYPENVFTLLGGAYDVHASEGITRLCPRSVCGERSGGTSALRSLSHDAYDVWREQISLHESRRQLAAGFVEETVGAGDGDGAEEEVDAFAAIDEGVEAAPARFEEFVDSIRPGAPPSFHFLHLLLPHQPWRFYPSGTQYPYPEKDPGQPQFVLGGRWGPEARPAELGRQRHLLQVRYLDALVGRLVESLQERGVYDDSLIVVTADHGAAFEPDEEVRPGLQEDALPAETFDQVMWTPLLIKAPQQAAGEVSDVNMQSIDFLPTLADLVGVRLPWDVDGSSVVSSPDARSGDRKVFYGSYTVPFERTGLGRRYEVDGRDGLRQTLEGGVWAFAGGDDPDWALYRVGAHADLVGRQVSALTVGPASDLEVRVDDPSSFAGVDPSSGMVPGLVLGDVVTDRNATIAVAVNGTIAGVSPTFFDNLAPHRFAVLVPDFLFRPGANDVRLFAVEEGGGRVELRPLRVDGLG